MIDIKNAVKIASEYLTSLISLQANQLLVEEVEQDSSSWLITMSYPDPESSSPFSVKRYFKEIKIRKTNGEVVSMKIKKI